MRIRFPAAVVIPLLLSGCSNLLGAARPDLTISLSSEVPLPNSSVFRVAVGGRRFTLEPGSDPGVPTSREVRAPGTGEREVQVLLLDPSGVARAQTSFTQRFEEDNRHWIAARIGERRPLGHCIGELIALPLRPPLSASRADSAFIMYGRIPEGAIC